MNKHRQMTLFMHIVDSGSISKASEKLDLSKSVLSQALKQLEKELECTLLKRTTRKQSLTPQGQAFYQHCLAMNEIVDKAWLEMKNAQSAPSGRVSITASHALMESVVTPAVATLFKPYPDVILNLIADDKPLDLMQHDIDLAIRVGESKDSNYRQRKVGEFRDVLCQSKWSQIPPHQAHYVANQWQKKQISHRLTHQKTGDHQELEFNAKHRANTINQVATMVEMEMGIGLLPEFLLHQYANITPCLPNYRLPKSNVYAIHSYSRTPPIAVSMAIEAIEQHLKQAMNT
tara:strand:+ start:4765 stop:5631 length:867 start_codon:yes stop_codon:yes gene_type:complete